MELALVTDGLTTMRSSLGPQETVSRLANAIGAKGLTIFARIDHAAGAAEAGLTLRPTTLLVFGDAKGGTPLMQASQAIGIDLPLKALIWQDAEGSTWLSYNDPRWLAERHGLGQEAQARIGALSEALETLALAATSGHRAGDPDRR